MLNRRTITLDSKRPENEKFFTQISVMKNYFLTLIKSHLSLLNEEIAQVSRNTTSALALFILSVPFATVGLFFVVISLIGFYFSGNPVFLDLSNPGLFASLSAGILLLLVHFGFLYVSYLKISTTNKTIKSMGNEFIKDLNIFIEEEEDHDRR